MVETWRKLLEVEGCPGEIYGVIWGPTEISQTNSLVLI